MTEYSIQITVKTAYLENQSDPRNGRFAFAYTIRIDNQSSYTAQLLSRHWIITDANNKVQEVQGDGVIGEQPTIDPGSHYTYSSSAMLETEAGTMEGSYTMISPEGDTFQVPIPAFSLTHPNALH